MTDSMETDPGTTLAAAKGWLRERLGDGAPCPCCTQWAKIYPRTIHSKMARTLVHMYRLHQRSVERHGLEVWPPDYVQFGRPPIGYGGDNAKLRYWDLIEPHPENEVAGRPERKYVGKWRLTALGIAFVKRQYAAPRTVLLYDKRKLRYADPDDVVDIVQALGKKYDYEELMSADVPLDPASHLRVIGE